MATHSTRAASPDPAAIVPVRSRNAVPAATVTASPLRRAFGKYMPSRRTFGKNNPSRRTFGVFHPSRRTFGKSHP